MDIDITSSIDFKKFHWKLLKQLTLSEHYKHIKFLHRDMIYKIFFEKTLKWSTTEREVVIEEYYYKGKYDKRFSTDSDVYKFTKLGWIL